MDITGIKHNGTVVEHRTYHAPSVYRAAQLAKVDGCVLVRSVTPLDKGSFPSWDVFGDWKAAS